jgi:hypothetical protein
MRPGSARRLTNCPPKPDTSTAVELQPALSPPATYGHRAARVGAARPPARVCPRLTAWPRPARPDRPALVFRTLRARERWGHRPPRRLRPIPDPRPRRLMCDTVASLDARHSRNASGAERDRARILEALPYQVHATGAFKTGSGFHFIQPSVWISHSGLVSAYSTCPCSAPSMTSASGPS